MPSAFIIGGTGLVGRATARRLLASGWAVTVAGRDPAHLPPDIAAAGGVFVAVDRDDPAALAAAYGPGTDLLVDCVCYTGTQASALLPLVEDATSTVMISSKAVYVDAVGNHSNSDVPPDYGGPVPESQPTMAPGDMDYRSRDGYGANKVAAEQILLDSGRPVTVLRPSKIHGEGARPPREWVFVKRILDRRPAVFLAHRGEGADHPTAAANIAALIETVAAQPGRRILNSADPDTPNGRQIARVIAELLGHTWNEVLLDDDAPDGLGRHPWDRRPPVTLNMTAALALGYVPAGTYAETVATEVAWLTSGDPSVAGHWGTDGFFDGYFDYDAEDRYLAQYRSG